MSLFYCSSVTNNVPQKIQEWCWYRPYGQCLNSVNTVTSSNLLSQMVHYGSVNEYYCPVRIPQPHYYSNLRLIAGAGHNTINWHWLQLSRYWSTVVCADAGASCKYARPPPPLFRESIIALSYAVREILADIQGEHKVFPWLQIFITRKLLYVELKKVFF